MICLLILGQGLNLEMVAKLENITGFYKTHRYDFNILMYVFCRFKFLHPVKVNPVKVATFKNATVVFLVPL